MRLEFDLETDGLLEEVTKVHSLVIKDIDTGRRWSFHDHGSPDGPILAGLDLLAQADEVWGHNVMRFDLPVIRKLYPSHYSRIKAKVRDTLLMTRLIWTDIDQDDYALARKGKLPSHLIGSHSLEAWGYRLGVLKGEFGKTTDWAFWSAEMQAYCEQDVEVTTALRRAIERQNYSAEAIELEHRFAEIIYKMEDRGFAFDTEAAIALYTKLVKRRDELRDELQKTFPPQYIETRTPAFWVGRHAISTTEITAETKRDLLRQIKDTSKRLGLSPKHWTIHRGPNKVKAIPFNPGSRQQVAERLMALGWKPSKATETGLPQVDETVLESLPYPEAKLLAEFFMVQKRLGQLAEGEQAWLKKEKNGRVYHSVNTNRAVTGRCGHHDFNIAQVPRVGSPYGEECRALFTASPGMVLVGADASGLELRCLAHYLAPYDNGAYAKIVTEGDVHTSNRDAFGLPADKEGRQHSKNGIYCTIYGGGDERLGLTLVKLKPEYEAEAQKREVPPHVLRRMREDGEITPDRIANWKRGNYAREKVATGIVGYGELVEAVATVVAGPRIGVSPRGFVIRDKTKARGWLRGLDGRRLRIRSPHAALNTLLQSAGALLVKKATVIWYDILTKEMGFVWGIDFALVAHVHDEIEAEARPEIAEIVGKAFVEALRRAGAAWGFRCPLSGEYKIGKNWAECH